MCVSTNMWCNIAVHRYAISIRSTIRIEQEYKNSKRQIKNSEDTWRYARLAIRRRVRAAYRRYLRTLRSNKLAMFYRNINLIMLVVRRFLLVLMQLFVFICREYIKGGYCIYMSALSTFNNCKSRIIRNWYPNISINLPTIACNAT